MGNQLAQPQKLQAEHLAEVPKVVLKDNLGAFSCLCCPWYVVSVGRAHTSCMCARPGGGRFLKTLHCIHDDGGARVVVKVRPEECLLQLLVPGRLEKYTMLEFAAGLL